MDDEPFSHTGVAIPTYLADLLRKPMENPICHLQPLSLSETPWVIGKLKYLSPEIIHIIVGYLDIQSIARFMQTCHCAQSLVQTCPLFRAFCQISGVACYLKEQGLLNYHTLKQLIDAVRREDCVCCHVHSQNQRVAVTPSPTAKCRIGTNLFLPTLERACESCLRHCPRYILVSKRMAPYLFSLNSGRQLRFDKPPTSDSWHLKASTTTPIPTVRLDRFWMHLPTAIAGNDRSKSPHHEFYSLRHILEAIMVHYKTLNEAESSAKCTLAPTIVSNLRQNLEEHENHWRIDTMVYDFWEFLRATFSCMIDNTVGLEWQCYAEPSSQNLRSARYIDHGWPEPHHPWWIQVASSSRESPLVPLVKPNRGPSQQFYWCWACHYAYDDNFHYMEELERCLNAQLKVPDGYGGSDEDKWDWLRNMNSQAYKRSDLVAHSKSCQLLPLCWLLDHNWYDDSCLDSEVRDLSERIIGETGKLTSIGLQKDAPHQVETNTTVQRMTVRRDHLISSHKAFIQRISNLTPSELNAA